MGKIAQQGIRSVLLCLVPLLCVVRRWTGLFAWLLPLNGLLVPVAASAAAVVFELPASRKALLGPRRAKKALCLRVPFLVRLVVLCALQIWWLVLADVIDPAAGDGNRPAEAQMLQQGQREERGEVSAEQFAGLEDGIADGSEEGGDGSGSTEEHVAVDSELSSAEDSEVKFPPPRTISVVLPCAGEGVLAAKTVESVFKSLSGDVLAEIVVVDDGSSPPLGQDHLTDAFMKAHKAKLVRHEQSVGLIGAKSDGAAHATGDVIVFFDCHVAPQGRSWHKRFLELIAENYRRIVVPTITNLDIDTWKEVGGGGVAKCYLTWDADFKWFESKDEYIPVISGGLLAMSARWWKETGGYDDQMRGWGGENIDQSLRTWLCGGEIVTAPDVRVAHMWRVAENPKTSAHYRLPPNAVNVNRMRAAAAWYGEFMAKIEQFPVAHWGHEYGDISGMKAVHDRLKCKPLAWFLRRFKSIYIDGGMIPDETFILRENDSHKCLQYNGQAGTSPDGRGVAKLVPCNENDDRQRWHGANKNSDGACCSGIRAWNTDQCIESVSNGHINTYVCDVAGRTPNLYWTFTKEGLLQQGGGALGGSSRCAVLKEDHGQKASLKERACRGATGSWSKVGSVVPLETRLYNDYVDQHPDSPTR